MGEKSLKKLKRQQDYMLRMKPVFNKKALFADTTKTFCSNASVKPGESVTLRFRTGRDNADAIFAVTMYERKQMKKVFSRNGFDYYEATFNVQDGPFRYFFTIELADQVYYFNEQGVSSHNDEQFLFKIYPGFSTPDWAKGAVFYQIFVERFCNGDPRNDVKDREYIYIQEGVNRVSDWHKYPDAMGVREFYGGDLQGVLDKLDYLQELGVDAIYFNPLFVSPSNHKYDIQDYDYIDPHFGVILEDGGEPVNTWASDNRGASCYIQRVTNKKNLEASNRLFIRLVEEIHRRGMKVILDGVFNHCGSFNKWMDRERIYENQPGYEPGAFISADSPYHNYFSFFNDSWPYNTSYDGWWGHDTLPKFNYEKSEQLQEEILRIARKWVSPPYNVDGWRLDVAADLGYSAEFNHEFWRRFRKAVKEANPNALILAEHYGDPQSWLCGDQWDSVMNYDAFMEPVTWFLTGMQKHSDAYREDLKNNVPRFQESMRQPMSKFGVNSLPTAMNELSNHDHSRFLTRTNGKVGRTETLGAEAANQDVRKGVMREAVVILMTWPGSPTIYYGDEAGLCGFTDPDNRRGYPWGHEDFELIEFHRDMIRMHKEHPVFVEGSLKFLNCSDPSVLAYGRFDLEEEAVIAVNNTDRELDVQIDVWSTGMPKDCEMTQLVATYSNGYSIGKIIRKVERGNLELKLEPESAVVLLHREEPIEKTEWTTVI